MHLHQSVQDGHDASLNSKCSEDERFPPRDEEGKSFLTGEGRPCIKRGLSEAPLFIEVCCGCALLSSCAAKAGFDILPIDFEGNKQRPFVHVVQLDLRHRSTWEFLEYLAFSRRPFHLHAAPPCGTASRARDVPMSSTEHGPPPLRSEQWPLGLPGLKGVLLAKVESANSIYLQLCAFCFFLNTLGLTWSIENPYRSYMWSIREFVKLAATGFFVGFHSCVHGGFRKKLTGLLTNLDVLRGLEGYCQDDHEHLEWGHVRTERGVVFDTSKEAAYPKLLCERFATLLSLAANSMDYVLNPQSSTDVAVDSRVAAGKQPRGRRVAPLVSEFEYTKTKTTGSKPVLNDKKCLLQPFFDIPAGSKLLRSAPVKNGDKQQSLWVFGVYRDAKLFCEVALSVFHPFDTFRALPDAMLQVVCRIIGRHPLQTMKERLKTLQGWRNLATDLKVDNDNIFSRMDHGCAAVLKGKHLALLSKLAEEVEWPDDSLHEELMQGFRLVGLQQPSGVFDADVRPRFLTEENLLKQSKFIKPALWNRIKKAPSNDYDEELWKTTMEEVVAKRWLDGPYSYEELDTLYDGVWNPVRRFAVVQRGKLRAIDDFTESGVNSSFGYLEKIQLKALDEIIWIASCFVKFCLHEERFDFVLQDGGRMCGAVHERWKSVDTSGAILHAKTVDLRSAYKQLAIHPCDRKISVLALKDPSKDNVFGFVSKTLPFGSTASVLHFNRVSRLIHRLGLQLDVPWANYYDDYPVVDFVCLSSSTSNAIRALMSLLGFECSLDKEEPFAPQAEMLGVVLDLGKSGAGNVVIRNKPSRSKDLAESIDDIIRAGVVEPRKLPSIFGRALFSESQLMGRAGKLAMSELRVLERMSGSRVRLSDVQLAAFSILSERYKSDIPRTITAGPTAPSITVFTDGACESVDGALQATVGAVIFFSDRTVKPRAFGCFISSDVLSAWQAAGKVHPVALTEMYAVCLARYLWCRFLNGQKMVFYIDNQGVLDCCIKSCSDDDELKKLVVAFEKLDSREPCIPWFSRVPSLSNCADLPSRGLWKALADVVGEFVVDEASCIIGGSVLQNIEKPIKESC